MIDLSGTSPVVVLDASVLFSIRATNLILEVATYGLLQPRWSDLIHDEWTGKLLAKNPTAEPAKIAKRKADMEAFFPDARVTGFEPLIPSLTLPDADDRHVLAAAIATRADAIVTFNLRDFPQALLDPYKITAVHPDTFLVDRCADNPVAVVAAARRVRARLHAPPQTADQFLQALASAGMRRLAGDLAQHKDQL